MSYRPLSKSARLASLGLATLLLAATATALTLPPGWRTQPDDASAGVRRFDAAGLPAGEFAQVRESPPAALGGRSLQQWLLDAISNDAVPAGTWTAPASATPRSTTLVTATRPFASVPGRPGTAIYFAVSADGRQARLLRAAFSSPEVGRGARGTQAQTLLADLMRERGATAPVAAQAERAAPPPRVADRYATTPGAGLRPADIETVYYHWDQRYDAFQGLTLTEAACLLLKDGTVHDGLAVPPTEFDVAASRRGEPHNWGRWRRRGAGYEFAWPLAPNRFDEARGNAVPAAVADTTLQGAYEGSASYALPGSGTATWSTTRVTLARDGRFEIERSGGAAVSGGGGDSSTMTVHDDERVASSTNSSVLATGGNRTRADAGDRRGRYRIDGYEIELRYENGTLERQPFFIDEGGAGIWLYGTRLGRVQPGKP